MLPRPCRDAGQWGHDRDAHRLLPPLWLRTRPARAARSPASAPRPLVRRPVPRARAAPAPRARRPQRRLGPQDPARARRDLPARRRSDLPGRGVVVARRRRPHRGARRAHRHDRGRRPVAGPPRPRGRCRGAHHGRVGAGRAGRVRRRERRLAGDADRRVVPRHPRHHPPRRLAGTLRPCRTPLHAAGRRTARPRHRGARARHHHRPPPGGGCTRGALLRGARAAGPDARDGGAAVDLGHRRRAGVRCTDRPGRHGRVRVPHLPWPLGRGPRPRDARGRRARAAPVGDRPQPRRPAAAGLCLLGLGPHLRGRGPGVRRGPHQDHPRRRRLLGGLGGGGGGGPAPVVRRPEGPAGRVAAGLGPGPGAARRGGPDEPGERRIPLLRRLAGAVAPRAPRREPGAAPSMCGGRGAGRRTDRAADRPVRLRDRSEPPP